MVTFKRSVNLKVSDARHRELHETKMRKGKTINQIGNERLAIDVDEYNHLKKENRELRLKIENVTIKLASSDFRKTEFKKKARFWEEKYSKAPPNKKLEKQLRKTEKQLSDANALIKEYERERDFKRFGNADAAITNAPQASAPAKQEKKYYLNAIDRLYKIPLTTRIENLNSSIEALKTEIEEDFFTQRQLNRKERKLERLEQRLEKYNASLSRQKEKEVSNV